MNYESLKSILSGLIIIALIILCIILAVGKWKRWFKYSKESAESKYSLDRTNQSRTFLEYNTFGIPHIIIGVILLYLLHLLRK